MKSTTRLAMAAVALAAPLHTAQSATNLGVINVTANRTALTADETLAPVTIITREEIQASQAKDLTSLLDGLPGIAMTNNGGLNKVTNIRLRGTGSNHVLVLVDGIRIGSATLGTVAFEHIPLNHIERIEVVRGPRSQLYGADAVGGVIQIFTEKGQGGQRMTGEIGYGSHDTRSGNIGISGKEGATDYSLRIAHRETDGYSTRKDRNPDDDGSENLSFSGHVSHRFDNGLQATLNLIRSTGNTEYDSRYAPNSTTAYDTDFLQQTAQVKLDYSPNEWWDSSLSLGESRDETTEFTDHTVDSFYNTSRKSLSWLNDLAIGESGLLTLGLDFLRDGIDVSSAYAIEERDNMGLFAQYQTQFGSSNLVIGLRHDDNESYGKHNTGNIAWGQDLSDRLRFTASYGTAFRAPTFNDLYHPWGGNPDLEPEKSRSFELGLDGNEQWGNWSLHAFKTDIEGLIAWAPVDPSEPFGAWQPTNINNAEIEGIEASLGTRIADWNIAASLTLIDPRDSDTGSLLTDRSRQTLKLDLSRPFGNTDVGITLKARSGFVSTETGERIGGHGSIDLRASHRLDRDWVLRGQIRNLLDREYEDLQYYNTGGRELFLSVAYEPK